MPVAPAVRIRQEQTQIARPMRRVSVTTAFLQAS